MMRLRYTFHDDRMDAVTTELEEAIDALLGCTVSDDIERHRAKISELLDKLHERLDVNMRSQWRATQR